jgi:D-alanyl-D-alanine carboxypeptidase/D-alanyl-D-alanine-endopeptidase (penicillin-binding protein 4)
MVRAEEGTSWMRLRRVWLAVGFLAFPLVAGAGRAKPPAPPPPVVEEVPTITATGAVAELLAPILAGPEFHGFDAGLEVVRVSDGAPVLAWQSDKRFVPASTMKILTSAAALDALGPAWTFNTDVLTDGKIEKGVLKGNLYIRGRGDPTLGAEKLWRMLSALKSDGISEIDGDIVLDDTYFTSDPELVGWEVPADRLQGPAYYPTVGACELEFGQVTLVVRPGLADGQPGVVEVEPPAGDYVRIEGELATGSTRARTRLDIDRQVSPDHVTFVVDGLLPSDAPVRRYRRTIPDLTLHMAGVVSDLLKTVGPKFSGKIHRGKTPSDADRLRRITSAPLASVLMDTNKYSSNFMAESIARVMGAELRGEGSTEAGMDVVRTYLERLGVSPADYVLINGSGLTRDARVTPSVMNRVLRAMLADPRVGPEFVTSLAIAGVDGTMERRLSEFPGRVRAKTGTLSDVSALAGYLRADDGTMYTFTFFANAVEGDSDRVKSLEDQMLRALLPYGAMTTPAAAP